MFKMKDINGLLMRRGELLTDLQKYEHEFKLKIDNTLKEINCIDDKIISLTYDITPTEKRKRECVDCIECMRTIYFNLKTGKLEINTKEYITFY